MLVTVFTPSFNRAHTIERVYCSLLSQTIQDFEWIIVDDGSTDGTDALVSNWSSEEKLNIRYIHQENKGKFQTLVDTIYRASGEWFLIADSDDEFVPETIQTFMDFYAQIPDDVRPSISGVSCLVKDSVTGQIVGDKFPIVAGGGYNYLISNGNEISFKLGIKGEKWGILKTAVLREFVAKVPDIQGSKYMSENVLWAPIATKYKTVYINTPLRIYYQGTSDTLSSRNIAGRYPLGAYLSERIILPCTYRYFFNQPKIITFSAVKLNYASILVGKSLKETIAGFPFGLKFLATLTRPLGRLAFIKYPRKK